MIIGGENVNDDNARVKRVREFRSLLVENIQNDLKLSHSKYLEDLRISRKILLSSLPAEVLDAQASQLLNQGFSFKLRSAPPDAHGLNNQRDSIFEAINDQHFRSKSKQKAGQRFVVTTPNQKKNLRKKTVFEEDLKTKKLQNDFSKVKLKGLREPFSRKLAN